MGWVEWILLGGDLYMLHNCFKEYLIYKGFETLFKVTPLFSKEADLLSLIEKEENKEIPYCFVEGTVYPIGAPISTERRPPVTGVIQIIKFIEHRIVRSFLCFWFNQQEVINVVSKQTPFEIRNESFAVEVLDGLSAFPLDVDLVYEEFQPINQTFWDYIFDFFRGMRRKGLRKTEEILKNGVLITGVGKVKLDEKVLKLQQSDLGPYMLVQADKMTLLHKVHRMKLGMLGRVVFLGCFAFGLVGFMIYRRRKVTKRPISNPVIRQIEFIKELKAKKKKLTDKQKLLDSEKAALDAILKCVICHQHPIQLFYKPCGHIKICHQCAERISGMCRPCRKSVLHPPPDED